MIAKIDHDSTPEFAVVVPAHNEAESVASLTDEIASAFIGKSFEIIFVNDGSNDGTADALTNAGKRHPQLRIITHKHVCGQSVAIISGIRAARAATIITLDGDGQNVPADAPALIDLYLRSGSSLQVMVAGHRVDRCDTWLKRASSRVANGIRLALLDDATPDTGCGLKVFPRRAFLEMPAFDHMHRFLPALMVRGGGKVLSVPVKHRPRVSGTSKYGVWNRLWIGIVDLFGIIWLIRRSANPQFSIEDPKQGNNL